MSQSHGALPEELSQSQLDSSAEGGEYRLVWIPAPEQCRSRHAQSMRPADSPLLFHGLWSAVRSLVRRRAAEPRSATAVSPRLPLLHCLPISSSLPEADFSAATRRLWDVRQAAAISR